MLTYRFKEPLTLKNSKDADPQVIGEVLAKIALDAGGELTPGAVVLSAQNDDSPLHRHFEWDDVVAAQKYRLDQAREIIRSITVEDSENDDGALHAFVSVNAGGVAYRTIQAVKSSRELQAAVLKAAERDLAAFDRRYRELSDVCRVVREARELVVTKQKEIESRAPM